MQVFGSGPRLDELSGDPASQAVAALRGYAYQPYVSALAWLALPDRAILHLEVAEDYVVVMQEALTGPQVRDTQASESITLQSEWVRGAIDSYVDLVRRNPGRVVYLLPDGATLETVLAGLELAKPHTMIDLHRQNDSLALGETSDRAADDLLRGSVGKGVRRIGKIHAEYERLTDERTSLLLVQTAPRVREAGGENSPTA